MGASSTADSGFLEATWSHALRIWWAWFWRWLLFTAGGVIVLNIPILGLSLLAGGSAQASRYVSTIVSFLLTVAAHVYTLWNILDKDFSDFSLRILEVTSTETASSGSDFTAPTLRQAIRVWWAWLWRDTLFSVAISFPVGFILAFFGAALGTPEGTAILLINVVNLGIAVGVWIYVIKVILRKHYKGFRIVLVGK